MSYHRVIPRDLFNEANLLKCLGKLWINLDNLRPAGWYVREPLGREPFEICQDENDGSIFCPTCGLFSHDRRWDLFRPLNSREEWPLWLYDEPQDESIKVFDDNGNFSPEMLALLARHVPA